MSSLDWAVLGVYLVGIVGFGVWAGRGNKQIDHVGRSLRTMLPRFDFLNTLPPNQHVKEIRKRHDAPNFFNRFLMNRAMPVFAMHAEPVDAAMPRPSRSSSTPSAFTSRWTMLT